MAQATGLFEYTCAAPHSPWSYFSHPSSFHQVGIYSLCELDTGLLGDPGRTLTGDPYTRPHTVVTSVTLKIFHCTCIPGFSAHTLSLRAAGLRVQRRRLETCPCHLICGMPHKAEAELSFPGDLMVSWTVLGCALSPGCSVV